jgi:hypothetical protein
MPPKRSAGGAPPSNPTSEEQASDQAISPVADNQPSLATVLQSIASLMSVMDSRFTALDTRFTASELRTSNLETLLAARPPSPEIITSHGEPPNDESRLRATQTSVLPASPQIFEAQNPHQAVPLQSAWYAPEPHFAAAPEASADNFMTSPPQPFHGPSHSDPRSDTASYMRPPSYMQFPQSDQGLHQQQYMLTLPSPPPFMSRLSSLTSPKTYFTFEEDYNHYKMVNPHHAPLMRIVNHVDKSLLIGTLLLGNYFTSQNIHLLTDAAIRSAIGTHFRRSLTTRTQFLDAIEGIQFVSVPVSKYLSNPESDLQPALTYLHQLTKFYDLLADLCPQAVPLEENFERGKRTTIKYIVDQKLSSWFPSWRQEIFDDVGKMRGKWPHISAWIQSRIVEIQRHLRVGAYIYANMDQAVPRLNPDTSTRKEYTLAVRADSRPGFNRPRGLWDPTGKSGPAKDGPRPPTHFTPRTPAGPARHSAAAALHAIEGDSYESEGDPDDDPQPPQEDDLSADTLSYYTPPEDEPGQVNALAPAPKACFAAARGETCTKPGCTMDHGKTAIGTALRAWLAINDKRTT